MCINSYIKVSPTTKIDMIYCHLLDNEKQDMEQICRYQRYCRDEKKYLFNNENNCKFKDKNLDGHETCEIT